MSQANDSAKNDEIRISSMSRVGNIVARASEMLLQQNLPEVTLRGVKLATVNLINSVDVLRRRIKGLHVEWRMEMIETTQGESKSTKRIPLLLAICGKTPKDTSAPGYLVPLPESEVEEKPLEELKNPVRPEGTRPRGTRGTRGTRGSQRGSRPNRFRTRRPRGTLNQT
mmetsp:Transcript_2929/g.4549  ORF Transcript_2929/g.4549 Transcript_2929/m.4549 type:complete len:169 (+) Transcript_2929:1871-2377(+)